MAEVSLIIPPSQYPKRLGYHHYEKHPLNGISEIRGVLIEDGHQVQVLDCRLVNSPHEYVANNINKNVNIIGFTTLFDSYSFICQSVQNLKNTVQNVLFIAGGPTASGAPLPFLKEAGIDIVVRGEGETAIQMLAKKNFEQQKIPGICFLTKQGDFKETGQAQIINNLDTLPLIDWSYMESFSPNEMEFIYTIGRGCKNKCAYCLANAKLRRKSPERVREELVSLMRNYGLHDVILTDSDFLVHNNNLQAYLDIFKDMELKWGCFTTPQDLTPDLLNRLSKSGCANIRIGLESFDEKTLKRNRSHISVPELYKSLDVLEASNIEKITTCLIIGLPGQTDKALEKTVEAIEKRPRFIPRPFCLLPLPGSQIFIDACEKGIIPDVSSFLKSLKNVPIDRYSDILPNFSDASPKCLNDAVEALMGIAFKRSMKKQYKIII